MALGYYPRPSRLLLGLLTCNTFSLLPRANLLFFDHLLTLDISSWSTESTWGTRHEDDRIWPW